MTVTNRERPLPAGLSLVDRLLVRRELALVSLRCRLLRSNLRPAVAVAVWLGITTTLTVVAVLVARSVRATDLDDVRAIGLLVAVVLAGVVVGGVAAVLGRWAASSAPLGLQALSVLPVSRRAWGASVALPFRLGALSLALMVAPLSMRVIDLTSGYGSGHAAAVYVLSLAAGYVLASLCGLVAGLAPVHVPPNLQSVVRSGVFITVLVASVRGFSLLGSHGVDDPFLVTGPVLWPLVLRYALFNDTSSLALAIGALLLGIAVLRWSRADQTVTDRQAGVHRERRFDGRHPWLTYVLCRATRNPRTLETISVTWFTAVATVGIVTYLVLADLPITSGAYATMLVFGTVGASMPGLVLRGLSSRRPTEQDFGLSPVRHLSLLALAAVILGLPAVALTVVTAMMVDAAAGRVVVIYLLALLVALTAGLVAPPRLGDGSSEAAYTTLHLLGAGLVGSVLADRIGLLPLLLVAAVGAVGAARLALAVERGRRAPIAGYQSRFPITDPAKGLRRRS